MKLFFTTLFSIILLLAAVSLHMGVSYILPYPWSKINILFTVLLLLLVFRGAGSVVWMSFLAHFFLELYAVTPFGVLLLSGTLSMLFTYWAYQYLFSNRSWHAMVAMSIVTLILYRCIYGISLFFAHLIYPEIQISWSSIFETVAWEVLLTAVFISLLYLLFFYRRVRPLIRTIYGR